MKTYESTFSNILIQSSFIFIFLTMFFFYYVAPVEKQEFENQISSMVNDIYSENSTDITKLFSNDPTKKKIEKIEVYGMLDMLEESLNNNTKSDRIIIDQNNNQIVTNSVLMVLGFLFVCGILFFLLTQW